MSYAAIYANQQRDPRRNLAGVAFVVVFHALFAWALMSGLAREAVNAFKDPLAVRLIEEPKPVVEEPPPPPPPPKARKIVAQSKAPPPPAWVPPPEVVVAVQAEPTIAVIQHEPPPPAPPPAPAPVVVEPAPEPVAAAVGAVCPNHLDIRSSVPYPPQALRTNKSGEVLVEFVVNTGGSIGSVRIVRSSDPVFNKVVVSAVKRFRCVGQAELALVRVPFQFALD
ncbi:MAG: energy transducer TonB [Azoarcus sp.]|nr:energy transducer TonB [Azoarcus sp.]